MIKFNEGDTYSGVGIGDPDGAYIFRGARDVPETAFKVQVVVKGPMKLTPGQYERELCKHLRAKYRLVAQSFLTGRKDIASAVMRIGFVSLIFAAELEMEEAT